MLRRVATLLAASAGILVSAPLASQPPEPAANTATEPGPGENQQPPAFAPAASVEEAFLHLQVAIGQLSEAVRSDPRIDAAAVAALDGQINELQGLFNVAAGSGGGADYVQSLDVAADAIMAALGEQDADVVNRDLADLQLDFRIKIETARATLRATDARPDTIPVAVTAQRSAGGPAIGYFIRVQSLLRARMRPIFNFGDPTNPSTSTRLIPGVYVFHAFDRNGAEVPVVNRVLTVGLQRQRSVSLTLVIQ